MNVRSILAAGSLLASLVFPSLAGAQVQFRVRVGPRHPVTVAQPVYVPQQPQPVYVAPQPQPVYVPQQPQPVYVPPPSSQVYGAPGQGYGRRQRVVVIEPERGGDMDRRHGRRGRWHR